MVDTVIDRFHPRSIFLFGSYARGNPRVDSDVDLLVLEDLPFYRRAEIVKIREALRDFDVSVDVEVNTEENVAQFESVPGTLFYEIKNEKKKLYGR